MPYAGVMARRTPPRAHAPDLAVRTPSALAHELAVRTRTLQQEIQRHLATPAPGPLRRLHSTARQAWRNAPTEEQFADGHAQTIAYGLLCARWIAHQARVAGPFTRERALELLPLTTGWIEELFTTALTGTITPELTAIIDDLARLLDRADLDAIFGDGPSDPMVHFYEPFLKAYAPASRRSRGVYYTPEPIVSFLIRSIDEILREELHFPLGLADTTTWAERAHPPGGVAPAGIRGAAPVLQILDPAAGTGSFLTCLVRWIHRTLTERWRDRGLSPESCAEAWRSYVPQHLLPRLHGVELLMAPCAICHLTLAMTLRSTGYVLSRADSLDVRLGNGLDVSVKTNASWGPVTVVIGNPPYSGHSENNTLRAVVEGVRDYRAGLLDLRKPGQGKWLQDDYVKFIRVAEGALSQTPIGVLGFVTNNRYLRNRTFRGMRRHLSETFGAIDVVDLHGDSKRGDGDANVFGVQQGVAIGLFRRTATPGTAGARASVTHLRGPLRGPAGSPGKLDILGASTIRSIASAPCVPHAPLYSYETADAVLVEEYERGVPLPAIFSLAGDPAPGIVTTHDELAISFDPSEAEEKVEWLLATSSEAEARGRFRLCAQSQWNYDRAKAALAGSAYRDHIVAIQYRPFDYRYVVWHPHVAVHLRRRLASHFLGRQNLGLCTVRDCEIARGYEHVFCSRIMIQHHTVSTKEVNYMFPLYVYTAGSCRPSLDPAAIQALERHTGLIFQALADGAHGTFGPEDVFGYIYAVLHSPQFRARYADLLRSGFARIPLHCKPALFPELAKLGLEMVRIHLLEVPAPSRPGATHSEVIPTASWKHTIGGIPVLRKWLDDRRGRELTTDDRDHFQHMVIAIDGTRSLTGRIEAAIEAQGGIPGAFPCEIQHE